MKPLFNTYMILLNPSVQIEYPPLLLVIYELF